MVGVDVVRDRAAGKEVGGTWGDDRCCEEALEKEEGGTQALNCAHTQ